MAHAKRPPQRKLEIKDDLSLFLKILKREKEEGPQLILWRVRGENIEKFRAVLLSIEGGRTFFRIQVNYPLEEKERNLIFFYLPHSTVLFEGRIKSIQEKEESSLLSIFFPEKFTLLEKRNNLRVVEGEHLLKSEISFKISGDALNKERLLTVKLLDLARESLRITLKKPIYAFLKDNFFGEAFLLCHRKRVPVKLKLFEYREAKEEGVFKILYEKKEDEHFVEGYICSLLSP